MLATSQVDPIIRISDVKQPLNFAVCNWVNGCCDTVNFPYCPLDYQSLETLDYTELSVPGGKYSMAHMK